ncbi:hypothetical protein PQG76_09140 [Corynebacterium falsenii]|uniref:hypothetical protein n=1 Tax=Corynebacterium falsenii TaxID=108486 RepID=UPI00234C32BD|nr:hypothetical protein [Corynebacterium falsenii]MDC7104668.1 hypothetical protein [Corynebacterium falsenii]
MNRKTMISGSLGMLAALGLTACSDDSPPTPPTNTSSEVKELSSSPGLLPSHLALTPFEATPHGEVHAGSRFLIEFAAHSDATSAIADVPNGNPYVALPKDVQQGLERVTEESACPIADTLSVGSRMRLSLQCTLDEPALKEMQQKLSTVPQVSMVEPDLVAAHH